MLAIRLDDTGTMLVILAVGAGVAIVAVGVVGLFYLGRLIAWAWRR